MTTDKIVSVIIPCHNSELYIKETLQSVINQTYKKLEIIVVDDASTDNTLQKVYECENKIDKIIEVKENIFQSKARMKGAEKANGKYLLFLDSDDKIHPDYITECMSIMENNPNIDVCYSKAMFFDRINNKWNLPNFEVKKFLCENCVFMSSLIRKTAYDKVGGFDLSLTMNEDWELFISILKNGGRFHRIDKTLFYYRKRKDETSISDNSYKNPKSTSENYLKIYLKHYDFYIENEIYFQDLMSYQKYKDKYYNQWFKKIFYSFKKH